MNVNKNRLIKALEEKTYRVKLVHGNKGWMAVGMTFLTLAGLGSVISNTTTANASAVNNVAVTNVRVDGTVQLYKDVAKSNIGAVANRTLGNNTAWKTARAIKGADGETYFQVATNEYANAKNMDLSDETSKQDLKGVVVTGDNAFTRLYTNPIDGAKEITSRGLGRNTAWLTDKRVVVNGVSYNRVSTSEWVKTSDVKLTREVSRSEKTYLSGAPETGNNVNTGSHSGSGSSPHSSGTHVTPTVEKADVTIKAIDEKGNEIVGETVAKNQKVGSDYTATAQKLSNYTLIGNAKQTVKVAKKGNTITFTYKKNADTPVTPVVEKANVTIKAVDESGKAIADDVVAKDQEVGSDYTATAQSIKDYTLTSAKEQTVKVAKNGNTITFTYKKDADTPVTPVVEKANVIVKSVDEKGKAIADDVVVNDQEVDSDYTATAQDITGYTLTSDKNQTVKVDKNGNAITFTYKKDAETPVTPVVEKANVTVKSVDENGNAIGKDSVVTDQEVGKNYTATAKNIEGYTLTDERAKTVNVAKAGSTVTFTYKKDAVAPKTATVTIKYVDEKGVELISRGLRTVQVGSSITITVNPREIEGYSLVSDGTQTISRVSKNETLTFVYKKEVGIPKAPLTVQMVDTETGYSVGTTIETNEEVGKTITVSAPDVLGYDVDGPASKSLTIGGGKYADNMVSFKYKRNENKMRDVISKLNSEMFKWENKFRQANNVPVLISDSNLQMGAEARAQQQVYGIDVLGKFIEHEQPDGTEFSYEPHLKKYSDENGGLGENIGFGASYDNDISKWALKIFNTQIGDQEHYNNALDKNYKAGGFAVGISKNGTVFGVQDFGTDDSK